MTNEEYADAFMDFLLRKKKIEVIAWQPLPPEYQPEGERKC